MRISSSSRRVVRRAHFANDGAHVANGFDDIAGAGFALGANHGRAFGDAPQRFAQIARAADERNVEIVLPDVIFFVGGSEHFALVDEIHFQRFEHFRFGEVADADLGHDRNADGLHDFANDFEGGHARDAAFLANVGGHALERHDGAGAGFFGDSRLLGVGDVHDDAALEHFGEADLYTPFVGTFGVLTATVYFF